MQATTQSSTSLSTIGSMNESTTGSSNKNDSSLLSDAGSTSACGVERSWKATEPKLKQLSQTNFSFLMTTSATCSWITVEYARKWSKTITSSIFQKEQKFEPSTSFHSSSKLKGKNLKTSFQGNQISQENDSEKEFREHLIR